MHDPARKGEAVNPATLIEALASRGYRLRLTIIAGVVQIYAAPGRETLGVDRGEESVTVGPMVRPDATLRLADGAPEESAIPRLVTAWRTELARMRRSDAYQQDGPATVEEIARRYGWVHPKDAQPEQITEWLASHPEWGGHAQNNRLSMLSTFFKFCIKPMRLIRENPCSLVTRSPRLRGDGVREFTEDERLAVCAAATGHWKVACSLMAATMLRRGAVFRAYSGRTCRAVRCGMFNRKRKSLDIPAGYLKNRKAQRIPLNDEIVAVIEDATRGRGADEPIVPITFDEGIWLAILTRAGVPHRDDRGRPAGTHSFRKGGATLLAERGVHPQVAQQLLGHADIRQTMQVYTQLGERHQAEAVKNLTLTKSDIAKGYESTTGFSNENLGKYSRGTHEMPYSKGVRPADSVQTDRLPAADEASGSHSTRATRGAGSIGLSNASLSGNTVISASETPRQGLEPRGVLRAEDGSSGATGNRGVVHEISSDRPAGAPAERGGCVDHRDPASADEAAAVHGGAAGRDCDRQHDRSLGRGAADATGSVASRLNDHHGDDADNRPANRIGGATYSRAAGMGTPGPENPQVDDAAGSVVSSDLTKSERTDLVRLILKLMTVVSLVGGTLAAAATAPITPEAKPTAGPAIYGGGR